MQFLRTQMLIGQEALEKLSNSHVAVFGVGGVGGFVVEALARAGIGHIYIFDFDKIDITNINRQIIATHKTIGLKKVDVLKERVLDINPTCKVEAFDIFYDESNANNYKLDKYNYIIDAIDSVKSKTLLIKKAYEANKKIISAMGAGNKISPTLFEISTISKTSVCPLARIMRKKLKDLGITDLKVVYSKEKPVTTEQSQPGSMPYAPAIMGLIISSEVIKDLIQDDKKWLKGVANERYNNIWLRWNID